MLSVASKISTSVTSSSWLSSKSNQTISIGVTPHRFSSSSHELNLERVSDVAGLNKSNNPSIPSVYYPGTGGPLFVEFPTTSAFIFVRTIRNGALGGHIVGEVVKEYWQEAVFGFAQAEAFRCPRCPHSSFISDYFLAVTLLCCVTDCASLPFCARTIFNPTRAKGHLAISPCHG